ncbi:MAG: hypothetical protein B7Z73_08345 [Planctomycetia bacterium 21-64-5]|nr:MAG: hypothetical protein B7Z73_08345 [Planctomycetia bacterium 21-64-5]HQU42328.1 hypothetical protein [Pirellulales bacterium]
MLSDLDIFFGDANHAEARVYARLAGTDLPPGCTLIGRVVGPTCAYSQTLRATIPFAPRRPPAAVGASPLLAEAIVPDPCFWSQELPFLYAAEIELRCGGELRASVTRSVGIRPLGVRQRRLVWESRPWVVRAAEVREVPERPISQWRAADLAMWLEEPADETCRQASQLGVVLIADLTERPAQVADELRRLARWPAVAVAVLASGQPLEADVRNTARNLLLAERRGPEADFAPSPWADVVICEGASADAIAAQAGKINLPVVARRAAGWRDDPADVRRECDRLQRDLAGQGDFAGYVV